MSEKVKVLVVDDEPLARQRIRKMLKDEPIIQTIIEAVDGDDAFEKITENLPHILFLDIQMPGCNGFEMLEKLRASNFRKIPIIIFVTAFDEYALKAFRFHALDYLLKPFEKSRLIESFSIAVNQISGKTQNDYEQKLFNLLDGINKKEELLEWVSIKKDDKISLFKVEEIMWIEAQGNYISIDLGKTKHLIREKMDAVEAKLDSSKFIRIHRSSIINVSFIKEIQVWGRGEYKVVMNGGKIFGISKSFRNKFDEFFNKKVL